MKVGLFSRGRSLKMLALFVVAIATFAVVLSPFEISVFAHEALPEHFHFTDSGPLSAISDWFVHGIDQIVSTIQEALKLI